MGYRNLSQYKSIIVIKIIKKSHPIYIHNKFYPKKNKGKMYQFSPLCVIRGLFFFQPPMGYKKKTN